jgi:hypothetical protein
VTEPNISFEALKALLGSLHFPDRDILTLAGLAPLAAQYVAYSVRLDGRSLHVLLVRSVKPAAARNLDEAEARASILVLERQAERWAKLWPPGGP